MVPRPFFRPLTLHDRPSATPTSAHSGHQESLTRAIGTCRIAGQVAHRAIPHAVPHVVSPTVGSGAHISSGGRGLHAPIAGILVTPISA